MAERIIEDPDDDFVEVPIGAEGPAVDEPALVEDNEEASESSPLSGEDCEHPVHRSPRRRRNAERGPRPSRMQRWITRLRNEEVSPALKVLFVNTMLIVLIFVGYGFYRVTKYCLGQDKEN